MGNFNRDDRSSGGYRGGFSRGRGRDNFRRGGDREMFSAVCSNCQKECQVPFRPTGEKPVYCSDCFEKMGGRSDSRRPDRSGFRPSTPNFDQSKAQLDAINVKLDKILGILQPKVEVVPTLTPVEEKPVEEVKALKVKKATKVIKKSAPKKKK